MPRGRVMMPGFGNLYLGLPPPGGQQPYIEQYQEGTGVKPPVPVAPVPPTGQVAPRIAGVPLATPEQALAAQSGAPNPAVTMPEQLAVANQAGQAAAAARPAGFRLPDPLPLGASAQVPLAPLPVSPVDRVTAAAAGMPAPLPIAPVPGPGWRDVRAEQMPAYAAQQSMPVAPAGVVPPMRNPAVPAPPPVTSEAPLPVGPAMDEQRGPMTISLSDMDALGMDKERKARIAQLQTKAAGGDVYAQRELTEELGRVRGEQETKLGGKQTEQQVKALDAEIEGLKYAETRAGEEVKRLETEAKNRDVSADLELAQGRLREAQSATAGALQRKQQALSGGAPGVKPLPVAPAGMPVTGAKLGTMALKALGIDLSIGEKAPKQQQDAKAVGRVGAKVTEDIAEALNNAILGKRMKVAAWDEQGNQVLQDIPDPRYPGFYKGGKLGYEDLQKAEAALSTSFSPYTGGTGKQEEDLEVARRAAMVAWVSRNRYRPEFQEATSEWIRKNKADWERFASKIPVTVEQPPAAPVAVAAQQPPAGAPLETPAAPAPANFAGDVGRAIAAPWRAFGMGARESVPRMPGPAAATQPAAQPGEPSRDVAKRLLSKYGSAEAAQAAWQRGERG